MPVEPGVASRDDRPRVRVGGGFAGEVSSVELRDGGVEVVEVEHDVRRDPLVGVDLDDAEEFVVESPRDRWSAARVAGTDEGEALPAGRNDDDVMFVNADVGGSPVDSRSLQSRPVDSRR